MTVRRIRTLTLGAVLVPLIAVAAMAADCPKPTDFHDGWTVAAPDQEGLDPALICGIGPRLEALACFSPSEARSPHRARRALHHSHWDWCVRSWSLLRRSPPMPA